MKIAIDFGTTNTVVACWDEASGTADLIAIPHLSIPAESARPPLIPSLLYVHDGRSPSYAALSLVELAGEESLAELAEAIVAKTAEQRLQIIRGMFHATSYRHIDVTAAPAAEALIDALALALQDDSADIRVAAVYPLAWMGGERPLALARQAAEEAGETAVKEQMTHIIASFSAAQD